MIRFSSIIIQSVLLIHSTNQSKVKQAITAFKAVGKTIKTPLIKTIGSTTKIPIFQTFGNTMKNSFNMFRRNKNAVKTLACGIQEKCLTSKHNVAIRAVKYLGASSIKKFKYIAPLSSRVSSQLVRAPGTKSIQMRSAAMMGGKVNASLAKRTVDQMLGKELRSLINTVSKAKPMLPLLFAGIGLNKLTATNLVDMEDIEDWKSQSDWKPRDITGHDGMHLGEEVILPPIGGEKHRSTQIWLPGLGGTAKNFQSHFQEHSSNPMHRTTKVRILTAPSAKVSMQPGKDTNSWFDVKNLNCQADSYDFADVEKSGNKIKDIIEEEIELLKGNSKGVYIGGFSEGGTLALHVGLGYHKPLGAIVNLSGFKFAETEVSDSNEFTPVFLGHGTKDTNITFKLSRKSYALDGWIKQPQVTCMPVPGMDHEVSQKMLKEFKAWVKNI